MKISYLLCALFALSACSASPAQPIQATPTRCYASHDGLGYNGFELQLKSDATYVFGLYGDVGRWGEASGTWRQEHGAILLHETSNDGHIRFPAKLKLLGDESLKLAYHGPYYSDGGTNLMARQCAR